MHAPISTGTSSGQMGGPKGAGEWRDATDNGWTDTTMARKRSANSLVNDGGMYTCVCMCVCMYVTCVCVYDVHVCMLGMCVLMCACMHACECACMYVYICMHVRDHVRM